MKLIIFLLSIILVSLSGCTNSLPQNQVIASEEINELYTMNIVSSEETTSNGLKRKFMSVVIDRQGKEQSCIDLNSLLGDQLPDFSGVSLHFYDYNGDGNLDMAIGTPEETIHGMYRYALISVDSTGNQYSIHTEGFNEQGYLYTIEAESCPLLLSAKNEEGQHEIMVGIVENDTVVPARYVWDGQKFKFVHEVPYIVSMEQLPNHEDAHLAIEQTKFLVPLKPYDEEFDIYKSYILGDFDAVVYKNNKEISRLNINNLFGEEAIGWAGPFIIIFNDYNRDGMQEFAIGQSIDGSADFKYVLITIDSNGVLNKLNAKGFKEEGFSYSSSETPDLPLLQDPEIGVSVMLSDGGWRKGSYIWCESEELFLFSER